MHVTKLYVPSYLSASKQNVKKKMTPSRIFSSFMIQPARHMRLLLEIWKYCWKWYWTPFHRFTRNRFLDAHQSPTTRSDRRFNKIKNKIWEVLKGVMEDTATFIKKELRWIAIVGHCHQKVISFQHSTTRDSDRPLQV